ncbi:MAG: class I mannose-6-phosphate isomerase [Planctomycetaceae bacterium]|jgi:mannose-6-phosphate isomerase|nr:class I mannose-6-phosphate isomerase [Planctomycetaceae bacterium]MBT6488026.1 class I mannose-6-phosphate isomerase [Planctomycetaceae bacterium]MBT6497835.1 class I mannose-6-phosphate isomerase [Planctomycetaceae bacterium]
MQPLVFEPILKRIRWGGRRLGSVLGKPIGKHADYAESWEIADHGDDQSIVSVGDFLNWTLRQLVENKSHELFGAERICKQFPLLIKFLDAHDRLSLQVHPDDELAVKYDPQENGKTEAWVIIEAEPGSRLYAGLKEGVGRDELDSALQAGTAEDLLHSFTVTAGDCVFIPAGTVHAIGEGILLAEIQQMSDITFRLFDWGRLGSDGEPRELHIEDGLAATDFTRGSVSPISPRTIAEDDGHRLEELVRGEYFVIHRHTLKNRATASVSPDNRFHVLMVVDGAVTLNCAGETMTLDRGRTALVPAECDGEVQFAAHDGAVVIDSFLP